MYTLLELQQIIEQEINRLELEKEPSLLYEPIRYILSIGGKRLRPALTLMACNLFSDDIINAISPALGLEVFHNFTLLHDDIMDKSVMRRGKATVHTKWNDNVAILSGDAMCIVAYQLAMKCDKEIVHDVMEVFNYTAIKVCEGQQYDMDFEQQLSVTEDEYLKMIELKTSVLIAACLKTGAILANAPVEDANLLYSFGKNIGLAFQLQDDYLDVYGEPEVFGKNIGGDIVANKKTYMLIKALDLANGDLRYHLQDWISRKSFEKDEKIKTIKGIYNQLGIDKLAKQKIEFFHRTGLENLANVNVDADRKEELFLFAEKLINRDK
ncbi:MAG: polyprenyl synthetase family protein [Bacteroidota bacterium]